MKKQLFLLLTMILLIEGQSCKSILLKSKGITSPRLETVQSIQTYISNKLPGTSNHLFIARDSTAVFKLYNMIEGFPSVDFFTKDGELIDYNVNISCTARADYFAAHMRRDTIYKTNPKYILADILSNLKGATENDVFPPDGSDFYLLVYWAKYFGSLNKNAFEISKTLQKNKLVSVRVILVNLDFQTAWGMKKLPQIKGL